MAEIILAQFPGFGPRDSLSPPCYKAQIALRAKGLDFEVRDITTAGGPKKYNPRGRLPAMIYDGQTVVDSSDIIDFLEAKVPEPALNSSAPKERALVKVYEDWADEVLYFYAVFLRWRVPANFARLKELFFKPNVPAILMPFLGPYAGGIVKRRLHHQGFGLKGEAVIRAELKACLEALEALLDGQDYLAGGALSRADIAVYAVVDQMDRPELTPTVAEQIRGFPAISAWREKLDHLGRPREG